MLNSRRKFRAFRNKRNKYSNSCDVKQMKLASFVCVLVTQAVITGDYKVSLVILSR